MDSLAPVHAHYNRARLDRAGVCDPQSQSERRVTVSGRQQDKDLGKFALEMDDDLLQAAISAVDARLGPQKGQRALTLDDELATEELQAEIEATFAQAQDSVSRIARSLPEETLDIEISLDEALSVHSESETMASGVGKPADPADLQEILAGSSSEELRLELDQAKQDNASLSEELVASHLALEHAVLHGEKHKKRAIKLSVLRKRLQNGYDTMALRLDDQRIKLEEWDALITEQRALMAKLEVDRERLKTRHQRELVETRQFGQDRTFRELLPVLDNLDLTVLHANTTPPEKMIEGVGMVLRHLKQTLNRMGLRPLGKVGESFDPTSHEAIRYDADDQPAGTITLIHQSGYQLHERLIRAARVTVSSGPQEVESPVLERDEVQPLALEPLAHEE
ncbi:MAG: molecular chaperone GrpE [Cognaticolwellia sp.]|jgi:molecular chaperone GrpE